MSFFYLTAVKGDIPVHLLEVIVVKRLEYLKAILNGDSATYNEYVVEGSIYDNVGHFMLCVVTILSENTGFTNFCMKAEVELFTRRLAALAAYDLRSFSKKIIRILKKFENIPFFLHPLQLLCQHLTLKDLAQHVSSTVHSLDCTLHNISVNFKHCLTFIAKRQVELNNGSARIPCGKWKSYLSILFCTNLKFRIKATDLRPLRSDPRIMELLLKLKKELPFTNKAINVLTNSDVDKASEFFPLCMRNLHKTLRQKHRLSHMQRFHYSLFLKDIGMPIVESIEFWRAEYSRSPNGHHSCCHNWSKDEKKFLYGIRHMYGLEGCRKSYPSVSCSRIQAGETSCSEGGCPFKSFDNDKMVQLLSNPSNDVLSQINELKRKKQYTSACMVYLQNKYSKLPNCDNFSFNFTPVKYYVTAAKAVSMDL